MNRMLAITLVFLFCGASRSWSADSLTAKEVINRVQKNVNTPWQKKTVDTFKVGEPASKVTGVAVTFMATQAVLEKAVQEKCNLIITHEPTFYNHLDSLAGFEDDPVVKKKQAYIKQHGLIIWRFHDHAHRHQPDLINQGMLEDLKLGGKRLDNEALVFEIPKTSVKEFAKTLRHRLGAKAVQVVGDSTLSVTKVAFAAGSPSSKKQMELLRRADVQLLIAGESRQWETIPYVKDAQTQGRKKAMILLGHANSEEAGMKYVAKWMKKFVPEVAVKHISAGDPFVNIDGSP